MAKLVLCNILFFSLMLIGPCADIVAYRYGLAQRAAEWVSASAPVPTLLARSTPRITGGLAETEWSEWTGPY